mmetsp:Transcript_53029/g.112657  ORF Transcript_53029/g.112657 Transcript_53029/m.112657 type:complete len:109 (-) Transcript_53029:1034-1360(-)
MARVRAYTRSDISVVEGLVQKNWSLCEQEVCPILHNTTTLSASLKRVRIPSTWNVDDHDLMSAWPKKFNGSANLWNVPSKTQACLQHILSVLLFGLSQQCMKPHPIPV